MSEESGLLCPQCGKGEGDPEACADCTPLGMGADRAFAHPMAMVLAAYFKALTATNLRPGDVIRSVPGGKWVTGGTEFSATATWIRHHNGDWPFELVRANPQSETGVQDVSDPHCPCTLCRGPP